jgi:hypothetical protein
MDHLQALMVFDWAGISKFWVSSRLMGTWDMIENGFRISTGQSVKSCGVTSHEIEISILSDGQPSTAHGFWLGRYLKIPSQLQVDGHLGHDWKWFLDIYRTKRQIVRGYKSWYRDFDLEWWTTFKRSWFLIGQVSQNSESVPGWWALGTWLKMIF